MPDYNEIIAAEIKLNDLLPVHRLEHSAPAPLIAAAFAWSDAVWKAATKLGPMPVNGDQLLLGKALAASPVFICGVHRSGTTLVRDMLDNHPELVVLPSEGTWYTSLGPKLQLLTDNLGMAFLGREWLRRIVNPINQPPYWLLGRTVAVHSPYVDFARYLMSWYTLINRDNDQWQHKAVALAWASCTSGLGAKFWVDKTPANERYLAQIWRANHAAKIIHVIRNPLATLNSRKKMEPGISMRHALRDVQTSFKVASRQITRPDPRLLLIRYEELCENPQSVAASIAAFLRIDFQDTLYEPTAAGILTQANSSFISRSIAGKINNKTQQTMLLTNAEKDLLSKSIGDLSARLNYPLKHVDLLRGLYLRIRYRLF